MPAPGHTNIRWNSTINTIMCQCVKSVGYPLVIIFLGIHSPVLLAEIYDITELQQPDTTSPAMAGFYNVTPDGEQTAEDPLQSGFATSASGNFDPQRPSQEEDEPDNSGQGTEKSPNSNKKNQETRTIRIRARRKRPARNRADQFQCERHGFYYTNDGRCIIPAYGHLPVIPQPLPGTGRHPVTPN